MESAVKMEPTVFLLPDLKSDSHSFLLYFSFLRFIHLFLERGREGEREGGKYECVVACHLPLTGDLAHNPGMCPDWESNRQPFGSQAGAESTEPHSQGLFAHF